MAATKHFAVRLKRSAAGWPDDQRKTLASLGLLRMGRTIFLKDTPAVRGMLYKVVHVLDVTTHDGAPPASKRELARKHKSKTAKSSKESRA
jgi:large subunit ribosomal protein L30